MFNNKRLDQNDGSASPITTGAAVASLIGAGFYTHKALLSNSSTYANRLFNFATKLEDRSPGHILRAFNLSELASSYVTPNVQVPFNHLVNDGRITPLGSLFQRMSGGAIDVYRPEGLNFVRTKASSPYLTLSHDPSIKFRFAAKGQLTESAARYGAPINPSSIDWKNPSDNAFKDAWDNFAAVRDSQKLKRPEFFTGATTIGKEGEIGYRSVLMSPLFAKQEGKTLSNLTEKAGRISFGMMERTQKLMSTVGFGLRSGSYNKFATIPFVGEGRGILNHMMSKRVLPAYLLAGVALPYLDYKLNHVPSIATIDAFQSLNKGRATLTDNTPGARSVTDWYARTVPGPQYGPLALPLGGAFVGAALHYSDVIRGKLDLPGARESSWRIFAKEGEQTFLKYFNKKSPVAKGLAIGAALMLPFIPGMVGSRKTRGELDDIYSGTTPVPIKSGRWWEIGVSAFGGGTIKSWRPHWSVLWKTQSEKASLYGSEDNYWSHNPILHPLKYLKDPYFLEKQNYTSRPYPISSPAFSNVPLIGPLLAATIGKVIKPPVRMHMDEWDQKDYNLYSTRLEPRGPRVESKLERGVLTELAKAGYVADTQVPADNYRLDFVVRGKDGKKLAIEADGATYHTDQNADEERQKELENKGWDFARIKSGDFFSDPSGAVKPVIERLRQMGIEPRSDSSIRDVKSGLMGLANPTPKAEFGLKDTIGREAYAFSDYIGLPGFVGRSILAKIFPDQHKDVFLQGSRNMDSAARRYYERELGAGFGPSPDMSEGFGYSEPLRRFIQNEQPTQQANEIPNALANVTWIPGDDYYINYRKGDPYAKVEDGYARLPGAGYEALHPELAGLNPEDYPDINKMEILSDIAPYSREFQAVKGRVGKSLNGNTDLAIQYSRILDRVEQTKKSVLGVTPRIFTGETEQANGTVDSLQGTQFTVKELPGRKFNLSAVGTSAADMAAIAIGENNSLTRAEVAQTVAEKQANLYKYLGNALKPGTYVKLTVAKGSLDTENVRAVVSTNGNDINSELLDQGLGRFDRERGGSETSAMFGGLGKVFGFFSEEASFTGDEERLNPLRYIPTPIHTKLWQERDPIADYLEKEVYGGRMRRWDKPVHDFIAPYSRGAIRRVFDDVVIPNEVIEKRRLNSMTDSLRYLRSQLLAATVPGERSKYTNQSLRTFAGVDLFSESSYVASTLPRREALYFTEFVKETDPDKRAKILEYVSSQTAEALQAQWVKQKAFIETAEGNTPAPIQENGRQITKEGMAEYKSSGSKLDYGDYIRSREIAQTFTDGQYQIPDIDSPLWSENIDYEDVKLKIIQNEGYDAKDFNIFDDRANVLWRKPYIDGAVRELTGGDRKSLDQNRRMIENILLAAKNRNPEVSITSNASTTSIGATNVRIEKNDHDDLVKDLRRNPQKYW
jgi:very-short-patch-repair endonuclease